MPPVCVACVLATVLPLVAHADENDDAEAILRAYLADVANQLPLNDILLLTRGDAGLKKLHALGEEHLLKNKDILHKKAATDYLRLPLWKPDKKTVKLTPIYKDDSEFKDMVRMYGVKGYGIGKEGYKNHVTQWWEADVAARFLRERLYCRLLDPDANDIERVLEKIAPARMYRQGDDPEHPDIAFFDGRELLVLHLEYTDAGFYVLSRMEWYRVSLLK
jgi:hypothetical protein